MVALRGMLAHPLGWWLVVMNLLFGVMLYLFTRLTREDRCGRFIYTLYPLILLIPLYWQDRRLWARLRDGPRAQRDTGLFQGWEAAILAGRFLHRIRHYPSVFWSGLLHAAYFAYYVIILLGPILLAARGRMGEARTVLFS